MFEFFAKLFGYADDEDVQNVEKNNYNDEEESPPVKQRKNLLAGFSYLFKTKRIQFDDQFSFTVNYMFNDEVWIAAEKLALELGFSDPQRAVDKLVDDKYKRTINELVFNNINVDENNDSLMCVNKHGVLQLLDHLDFKNKAEFTAWIIEEVFVELENKFLPSPVDEKLNKVLDAVDTIKQHNDQVSRTNTEFKDQVIERFEWFNAQISKLDNKITALNDVDELYKRLQDHHTKNNFKNDRSIFSCSSNTITTAGAAAESDDDNNAARYVRFPRNTSIRPRLSVFVKPVADGTELAFVTAQQRNHKALKRKYNDMEMIYDSVHPNPQMAVHCINEELVNKRIRHLKFSRRQMHVYGSVDTVKSFINENL